jgi:hypothetical protein
MARASTRLPFSMPGSAAGRRKFLRFFPKGFADPVYLDTERSYKWRAHERWSEKLSPASYRDLLLAGEYEAIARHAVSVEARTNLLFSFEKMALRDAVRTKAGARSFGRGLFDFLHGEGRQEDRFEAWVQVLAALPRKQTRVLTWPLATVFGFVAQPSQHLFLKPNVTRAAARALGYEFRYDSRPSYATYASLLSFGDAVARDTADLGRGRELDGIDTQSFIWVQGSEEYAE